MIKKRYYISGIDCPSCADKIVNHLNKNENIISASFDFNNDKLFILYKEKEFDTRRLINLIKEVEDDEIVIKEDENSFKEKPLLNKQSIILIIRISLIILLTICAAILERSYFYPKSILVISIYLLALIIGIYDILFRVFKNIIHKINPFDENMLMSLSCIGAFCMAFFPNKEETLFFDGIMVLALFQIGELIEEIVSEKSKTAIKKAIELRPKYANLMNDEKIEIINPQDLKIDDLIMVKVGEVIPVDGVIISGEGEINTSSLTGESLPVVTKKGDHVYSGSLLISGNIIIKTQKTFDDSMANKIMELIENSGEKRSKVDKFITRFARIYTPIILIISILYTLIFGFITFDFYSSLYGGIFILIIGCPCAIVISIPLAFFAGIGLASKNGIVIKNASTIDALANIGTIYVDKTGTLTYGQFVVEKYVCKIDETQFKQYLYAAEYLSNHPLAKAIMKDLNAFYNQQKQGVYEEIRGQGIHSVYDKKEIYAGNSLFLKDNGIKVDEIKEIGTIIHLAVDHQYVGYVVLNDEIKPTSKIAIEKLLNWKIKIVMLSGDNEVMARKVADKLGISEFYGKLLPEEKVQFVDTAIKNKDNQKQVLFVGDGINDTPSIVHADVGVAMGAFGSDVSIDNADIIIMNDDPYKMVQSIDIAKKTKKVAIINIVVALSIKFIALILTMLSGYIAFPAHFIPLFDAFSDTGLTVVLALHSLLLFYKNVDDNKNYMSDSVKTNV